MSSQTSSQIKVLGGFKTEDLCNREALEKSVEELIGESVTLDQEEAAVTDLEGISWPAASALLVKENGRPGRIQIHEKSGTRVSIVMTGPHFDEQFPIAWLNKRKGQNFRFYGKPVVWFFRPVNPDP